MAISVVALYKTWSGEEFVDASMASIYKHVDKIIMVHSNVSWDGTHSENTVLPVVVAWSIKNDMHGKLINLIYDTQSQPEQYAVGMNYIKNNLQCDYVMLIDTDEVWDEQDLLRSQRYLESPANRRINAFCCNLHTYVKSPFYRITPPEMCKPTVFVRSNVHELLGVRGNKVKPSLVMPDVFMHHFTLVRNNINIIKHKIQLSNIGDGGPSVNINKWLINKWDKLGADPTVSDFHISKNFERSWKGIIKITKQDLPEVFQCKDHPMIKKFEG